MRVMDIDVYGIDLVSISSRVHLPMTRVGFFLVLIFLLFRQKISKFCINCFKFTQYFVKISQLIIIIIIIIIINYYYYS